MVCMAMALCVSCKKDDDSSDSGGGNGGGENTGGGTDITGTIAGHTYVDLGLPSGLLWATCNVGASKPEDYGGYYAWGETTTKDYYNWSTYKWCRCDGSGTKLTKYCPFPHAGTVDNRTTLELADDVAHVKWGGAWRMPTCDELNELWYNCTLEWTTLNEKEGYRVIGPNGGSIFLPAAGSYYYSSLDCAGSEGGYWSSSLYTDDPNDAYVLGFGSGSGDVSMYSSSRIYGHSVRPVCPSQN